MREEILIRMGLDQNEVTKGLKSLTGYLKNWTKRIQTDQEKYTQWWSGELKKREEMEVAASVRAAKRSNEARRLWRERAEAREARQSKPVDFTPGNPTASGGSGVGASVINETLKRTARGFRQLVAINLIGLASKAIEEAWDAMTRKAADLYYKAESLQIRGGKLDENRNYWRKMREEQEEGWKREKEAVVNNAKREEDRVVLLREAARIEEELKINAEDTEALTQLKLKHEREDLQLLREKMQFRSSNGLEDASKKALENSKLELEIAKQQKQISKTEADLAKIRATKEKEIADDKDKQARAGAAGVAVAAQLAQATSARGKFTLGELADINIGYNTTNEQRNNIMAARQVQAIEADARLADQLGNTAYAERQRSRADGLRQSITSLADDDRFPFQKLTDSVGRQEFTLNQLLLKASIGGLKVVPAD